jgi:hypothetical protein
MPAHAKPDTDEDIRIDCLRCSHSGTLKERELGQYGEKPGAPIAAFVKRLVCRNCGSHSVRAYRIQSEGVDR